MPPRSTYKLWAEPSIEEQLSGQRPMSHFEKSLAALEIEAIHTHSPQTLSGSDKGKWGSLIKIARKRRLGYIL